MHRHWCVERHRFRDRGRIPEGRRNFVVYAARSTAVNDIAQGAEERTACKGSSRRAVAIKADVSKQDDVINLLNEVMRLFGRVDVLVNNAGINTPMQFLDVTDENWSQIMDVNAMSVLFCTQEAVKRMIATEIRGKIINITSIGARQGYSHVAPYCASKFAVAALTQSAARAFAKYHITVNALAPGLVQTPMWQQVDRDMQSIGESSGDGEAFDAISRQTLIGRAAEPHEIGRVAVFLASQAADYITGQTIMADGGMVLV